MKKPLAASAGKKKDKTGGNLEIKTPPLKNILQTNTKESQVRALIQQMKIELIEKMDQKFNAFNHRLDRLEDGIEEVLDELRATEALLESETEPYEGQA